MEDPRLHLAEQFVLHTRKNIFLTGRAGTGKTTFLRNVLKKTKKKYIVVAPTGVAAINAGGVTIHSMFGFPLTAFTPDQQPTDLNLANNGAIVTFAYHCSLSRKGVSPMSRRHVATGYVAAAEGYANPDG